MAIKIALAGNPNCGKTTMFNYLTGSSQYVGNWPGVTVEKKEGRYKEDRRLVITDLPGVYSLSPYTPEEVVTRDYLVNERPGAILDLIDATNIERNLYLTTQLLETGVPVVAALNMMDVIRRNGDRVDTRKLSQALGCPVVETSALRGEGLREAVRSAVSAAETGAAERRALPFSDAVEDALGQIQEAAADFIPEESARWYAVKIFERDEMALARLALPDSVRHRVEAVIAECEKRLDDDGESIITNERYAAIAELVKGCVHKKNPGMTVSDRIDRVVTNRWLALPIFAAVMFAVYYVSVTTVGTAVTDFTNDTLFGGWIQPAVQSFLENAGTADWVVSLLVDGIIGGLAAPIGFAPQMAVLFLFLSLLEDCGYMARIAFIMDRVFRRFGLSGKSFIPLLISSGCGVPGIMASRTIENEKDRRLTMMTATFVPCGAKLPVIALIAGAVLGGAWWMAPAMYFIGIAAVIVSGVILKKTRPFLGDTAPFVMELPQYHMPSARNVLLHVWERVWSFLKKAGTILFLCCVVMWALATFGFENGRFGMVDQEFSLLAVIGGALAPVFAPLGFGSWQAVAASLSGFVAKEGIVSTLGVLSGMAGAAESDVGLWQSVLAMFPGAAAAFSFLLFNLLDSPCLAAISTMSKEMNSGRWTAFAIIYQNVFAYGVTLMVYQFSIFLSGGGFSAGTGAALIILGIFCWLLLRPASGRGKKRIAITEAKAGA